MENLSIHDLPAPPLGIAPPQGAAAGGGSTNSNALLGPAVPPVVQGAPQLPPQMFTTAAQLLDLTDKKLLLVLRDGRKLIGVLRSWDQFANLVLTSTTERYFVTTTSTTTTSTSSSSSEHHQSPTKTETKINLFADIPRGTYLVRGENVLLLGEIDLDKDDDVPADYVEGDIQEVFRLKKEEERARRERDRVRGRRMGEEWGGEMECSGEVLF